MEHENEAVAAKLHTLISLEEFKGILGVDDRDDRLSRFCLVTATHAIEQYCKRRLLREKHFEEIEYAGDLWLPLREYPVSEVLAVYVIQMSNEKLEMRNGELIEPEFYRVIPDCGTDIDLPFSVEVTLAVARLRCNAIKVVYWAGYITNEKRKEKKEERESEDEEHLTIKNEQRRGNIVPADLKAACLELASWNMSRYKGRRIGIAGNIRGEGIHGEHFEMSMPENVRALIEQYKRRVI